MIYEYKPSSCFACGVLTSSLQRCGRCKSLWYCSQECQQNDWKSHKFGCSPLPGRLEPWRGNKTSAFGIDYLKRLDLAMLWADAPMDENFNFTKAPYKQIFRYERKSPFCHPAMRKKREKREIPAYLLSAIIRVFLMHDISQVGPAAAQQVATLIDAHERKLEGGPYINGAKVISVPDKLSIQEYMTLADVWPPAFGLMLFDNPKYFDDIRQSLYHWKVVEIIKRRFNVALF